MTLALDGKTYRRLRIHAAKTDQTHQTILESALAEYLKHANEFHECLEKRTFNEIFPRGAVSGPNADRNRLLFPSHKTISHAAT